MQISGNDNDSANSLRSTWFFMSMFFVCGSYGKSEGHTKAAPRSNEKTRERGVRKKALCTLRSRFVVWPRLAAISLTSPTHKRKAHKKNHCYAGSRKNTFVFPSLKDFFSESNSWSISVQSLLSPESVLPRNSTLYLQDEQGYRNVLKYVH